MKPVIQVAGRRRIVKWILIAAALVPSSQTSDGADKRFPNVHKPTRANVTKSNPPSGTHAAWETGHFILLSDEEIDRDALQQFANTLESVPDLLEHHPLPLWSPIGDQPAVIRLCRDAERFEQLGGPEGSAGYFNGGRNEILIRADLFLSPSGSSARLTEPPDEGLLIHETCHFAMAGTLRGTRPWLSEGLAEYFSVAHQRGGLYRFDQFDRLIPKQLRRHLALKSGDVITLPSLEETLSLSNRDWSRQLGDATPEERYLPYAVSLLFVHYQLHGGDSRRSMFAAFIGELSERHPKRRNRPTFDVESPLDIEKQMTRYWSARGLRLNFESAGSSSRPKTGPPDPGPPTRPFKPGVPGRQ